jgi:hypothetical protein
VAAKFTASVALLALAHLPAPAIAQHMHVPGMQMPAPPKRAATKASPKKRAAKQAAAQPGTAALHPSAPDQSQTGRTAAAPVDHDPIEHEPAQPLPDGETQMPMDHSQMEHRSAAVTPMSHADHNMQMTGAHGPYPMQRESSGTAWQPDSSEHTGLMTTRGEWTLMAHGVLNFVYDHQSGRRGDDKAFASGMFMGMARRPLGNGTLQFKAMLSPEPLMGARGYPLLLASGETANGRDRLIDRQHPHDLFMELSSSVSQNIGPKGSVFLYAGLPGEPAFGPPAFMHREAIMDSPEAPISHHWLDSTHISFGVITAGFVLDRVKIEASRFNGREPDQHRWNIETGPLDSSAVRISWNPTQRLSLQGSWGHFTDPEQLEPGVDQKRWSASVLYAADLAPGWKFAGTLAWGRKQVEHHKDDAYVAEASLKHRNWTLFGRGEMTENRELTNAAHGPAYRVGKIGLGVVRDVQLADHMVAGLGGTLSLNFVPDSLAPLYGESRPLGAMAFVRLKLN